MRRRRRVSAHQRTRRADSHDEEVGVAAGAAPRANIPRRLAQCSCDIQQVQKYESASTAWGNRLLRAATALDVQLHSS